MGEDCLFYFLKISFCLGIYYDNMWDDRNIFLYLFKLLLNFKLNLILKIWFKFVFKWLFGVELKYVI